MTKSIRSGRGSLFVMFAALALFATACGGGGGSSSVAQEAAIAAGATNESQLDLNADLATTQVLNTADGSATSLSEVVTGDRAVLLWYWAPH